MLTLYDYLPSQNGYKVRLLLSHLATTYRTVLIGIFAPEGPPPEFLSKNPTGAVPVLELEDGRVLPESNAILSYLAEATPYLPSRPWERAQVLRWMFFEEDQIQNDLASLRYWTLTGQLAHRPAALVEHKRARSRNSLEILDRWLAAHDFLANDRYSIADMSVYAYVAFCDDAGIRLGCFPHLASWIDRVRRVPGFLDRVYAYSVDPHSIADSRGRETAH